MLSYFVQAFTIFLGGLAAPAVALYAVGFVIRTVFLLFSARPLDGKD